MSDFSSSPTPAGVAMVPGLLGAMFILTSLDLWAFSPEWNTAQLSCFAHVRHRTSRRWRNISRLKMNQLTSLLHDSLVATGHVQHCAIIRRKDISLRASTVGFSVSKLNIMQWMTLRVYPRVWFWYLTQIAVIFSRHWTTCMPWYIHSTILQKAGERAWSSKMSFTIVSGPTSFRSTPNMWVKVWIKLCNWWWG